MLTVADGGDDGLGIQRVELPDSSVFRGHVGAIFGYLTASYHSADASRQLTVSFIHQVFADEG